VLVEFAIDSTEGPPQVTPRGRWPVANGPTAVAYDPKHRQALVWSQFDHAITFVAFPTGSLEDRLVADKDRTTQLRLARAAAIMQGGEIELGRVLYHTTGDRRISREGLACASCHPDGHDDALTWATSDGPRQAPMLAGRLDGTAPYAWSGTSERVAEHLRHTMQRLGGSGLSEREMRALEAYCMSMKTYGAHTSEDAKVRRGREIFTSSATGCASCHTPRAEVFTDRKKHDVGSETASDTEPTFDTPSLRFVGGTAPYFHDGRYGSLHDLLVKSDGPMGRASQLPAADLDALEAYLRTL
jgi:cytochrome c peroxidase